MTVHANGNGGTRDLRMLEGILSNTRLFRGVGQHQVLKLAARAKAAQFRRGATVSAHDQLLPGLYAVGYGQIKLAFCGADEERVTRIVGPAETFGLAAALLGRPPPYEAVALDASLVVMVPTAAILQMLENDARFGRAVITELAERKMALLTEAKSGALQDGVQRLASYLDSLAGTDVPERCRVHLPTTKTVIAARLGMKKETLSRLLRGLVERGLIAVEQREIAILDRGALTAVARRTG